MAGMRVTVVGCSGSFPGPDSPASCYLLEAEGFRLVIDLGNGALGTLQRFAELFSIDAICLSHLHADHCIDVGAYWVARQFAPDGPKPPIPLYGPRGTADRVVPHLGPATGTPATGTRATGTRATGTPDADPVPIAMASGGPRFDFRELVPGTTGIGPFRVTADHMNHPVETFGFRIEQAGFGLAYSADTGESDALIGLARDVDLLLCEASFLDAPDNRPNLHLSARQAAEHATRAGAGRLVLTHLVPWNDRTRTQAEAASAYRGPLQLATSGLILGPGLQPGRSGPDGR
jgi:ribonuclease BN (tRNA processing enzyme)